MSLDFQIDKKRGTSESGVFSSVETPIDFINDYGFQIISKRPDTFLDFVKYLLIYYINTRLDVTAIFSAWKNGDL